jgi:hypothetical protein
MRRVLALLCRLTQAPYSRHQTRMVEMGDVPVSAKKNLAAHIRGRIRKTIRRKRQTLPPKIGPSKKG